MKFREQQNPDQGPIKLDLTDELHNKEMVEFGPRHEAVGVSKYREMVEALVLELTRNNPILQKIKNGAHISAAEAENLANLLNRMHPHITENLLRMVYRNRKARFIQFIRHILGIEILASFPDTVANRPLIISLPTHYQSQQPSTGIPATAERFHYRAGESGKTRSHSIALYHHSSAGDSRRIQTRRNR